MDKEKLNSEVRSSCKRKLESLELWLRRLIDQTLSAQFGDYFNHKDANGNRLIANRISSPVADRMIREPDRYPRQIDAVLLDDAISIICNPSLYIHFQPALELAFPDGCEEARTFMARLTDPRNKLAHANPISSHDAERVFCYSSDIIGSISHYYSNQNMNQEYNVPLFVRFTDSFGNAVHRDQMQPIHDGGVMKIFHRDTDCDLRPGHTLSIEVEVDSTFDPSAYTLRWTSPNGLSQSVPNGPKANIEITAKQVAQQFSVMCTLTTRNEWHRMGGGKDDFLMITYRVLPPI